MVSHAMAWMDVPDRGRCGGTVHQPRFRDGGHIVLGFDQRVWYAATSTQGRFAGIASGALPGAWSVTVDHTPLGTSAAITGGDFHLGTRLDGTLTAVTGDFTGGAVTQLSGFTGCVNQRYAVNGVPGDVGFGSVGSGTGAFVATLTHYRTRSADIAYGGHPLASGDRCRWPHPDDPLILVI